MAYRRTFLPGWKITLFEIIVKTDVTLAGLELGLLTMKKGEFSRFLFEPQYAYGDMGCPPFIPAAAVVLYEVQILDFLDSGQVDNFIALSPVGRLQMPRCCTEKKITYDVVLPLDIKCMQM